MAIGITSAEKAAGAKQFHNKTDDVDYKLIKDGANPWVSKSLATKILTTIEVKASTRMKYSRVVNNFIDYCHANYISNPIPQDARNFCTYAVDYLGYMSSSVRHNYPSTLFVFGRACEDNGYKNILQGIDRSYLIADIVNPGHVEADEEIAKDIPNQTAKKDAGKPRMELIPTSAINSLAKVLTYGADKYSEDSWKGVARKRYLGAIMRHLVAYMDNPYGVDSESGLYHIEHVLCNAAFLNDMTVNREEYDDTDL